MSKRKSSTGVLIVVELGAEWPNVSEALESALSRRVLAQEEGESPAVFGTRVATQFDSLFARGVSLATVVVACNERLDEHAHRARAELSRAAVGALAAGQSGHLFLSALERDGTRVRDKLAHLADELGREWQGAGVRVTVHGGERTSAPKSSDISVRVRARGSKDPARKVA